MDYLTKVTLSQRKVVLGKNIMKPDRSMGLLPLLLFFYVSVPRPQIISVPSQEYR